jgi:hypothetical protein
MTRPRLEIREESERLWITYRLRPERAGQILGIGWLAVWLGAIVSLFLRIKLRIEEGREVLAKEWLFAVMMPAVGVLVLTHVIALWRGWRQVQFAPEGITVIEQRWRRQEKFYPVSQVTRLRGTYAGWREMLLFDFDGKPVGIELPMSDEERSRLLQRRQVQPFVEAGDAVRD